MKKAHGLHAKLFIKDGFDKIELMSSKLDEFFDKLQMDRLEGEANEQKANEER